MSTPGKQPASLYNIVVTHYLVSALCFLILAIMLFFSADELWRHYFSPKLLALTHMAALGWGTLIIIGASYQLIAVIFETDLYSYKLPWVSFGLFICGLILLVCSFWVFDPGILMQTGSIFLFIAILLFTIVVLLTAKNNKSKASIHQEFMVTSCMWLLATAAVGILMVFNFRYPFLPKDHLHFLRLHAHMGIAGWFLLLIIGVSSKLIPMFLVSRRQNEKALEWSYYLINTGLILFIIDTYISGINVKTFFIAFILLLGITGYLIHIITCFRSRIKNQIDLPITNTVISFMLMGTAVIVLPLIIYNNLKNNPQSIHYTTLYGMLLFMGWISSLILGQAFKTLPFIVWVKKYEHLVGKTATPLPADLYKKTLLRVQTCAFVLFVIAFYPGYIFNMPLLLYIGIAGLILTAIVYLVNLSGVIFHKSKKTAL